MKSTLIAVVSIGVAAIGGALAVYSEYDDSPGGFVLSILIVLAAMALGARNAWRHR
jgi:hypothetical protein